MVYKTKKPHYTVLFIVCSHSLGSWVGLKEAIQDQSVIDMFSTSLCNHL